MGVTITLQMSLMIETEQMKNKPVWKKNYTLVLLLNIIYIVLFYFLMEIYS